MTMISWVVLFGLFAVCVQGQFTSTGDLQCYRNGKYRDPGTTWVDSSCTYKCNCYPGGRYSCRSLCYNIFSDVRCSSNQVKKYRKAPVPGTPRCQCDKPYCDTRASIKCYRNGKYFNKGETWVDSSCTYKCSCRDGGRYSCRSLCNNIFSDVRCGSNQVKKYRKAPVPGTPRCQCDKPYCETKQTRKDYCFYNNKRYSVGQSYIDNACKWKCTCYKGGRVNCVTVCATYSLRCPSYQTLKYTNVPVPGSNCKCRKPECVNRQPRVCRYGGKTYPVGQSFVDPACTGRCTCQQDARVSCIDLCSTSTLLICRSDEAKQTKRLLVPGSKCYCNKQVCVKKQGICRYRGITYQAGQSIIDSTCTARCTCKQDGSMPCIDLCRPTVYAACGSDQVQQIKRVPAPGTQCFCDKPVCVKKQVRCYRNGKYYNAGQKWIEPPCRYKCSCGSDGVYSCQSVCPTITKTCTSNQVKQIRRTAVPGSNCQCSEPICVDITPVVQYCNFRGSYYRVGTSFVDPSCKWKCDCNTGGVYKCSAACWYIRKRCGPFQKKMFRYTPVPGSKSCRCKIPYCSSNR